jgi:hypothetical protein
VQLAERLESGTAHFAGLARVEQLVECGQEGGIAQGDEGFNTGLAEAGAAGATGAVL